MRYPGLNALLSDPFAPVHGNTFVWKGFTYKVVVRDYGAGGKLAWLDRNLGASRVAQAGNDDQSYGDLYQWGRANEGHQVRTSNVHNGSTEGFATTVSPNEGNNWDGKFITDPNGENRDDWIDTRTDGLWQGTDGINNPSPPGWRLPTNEELNTERLSWDTNDRAGAFGSTLKFPWAGSRSRVNGTLSSVNTNGWIWASSTSSAYSNALYFLHNNATINLYDRRALGISIRCVRTI